MFLVVNLYLIGNRKLSEVYYLRFEMVTFHLRFEEGQEIAQSDSIF